MVYEATCGKFHFDDLRDKTICCFSCGWCVMDVLFPFMCPKFHPPFQLRLMIVKARCLQGMSSMTTGYTHVYAECSAGNNPKTTTSVQPYNADDSVWWNEPIDLIIPSSLNSIRINIKANGALGADTLGTVDIPVDGFYEPPGPCHQCTLCGVFPCPKLFGSHKWPFVRGAPRDLDYGVLVDDGVDIESACCCDSSGNTSTSRKRVANLFANAHVTSAHGIAKSQALERVRLDGNALGEPGMERWRNDEDVVVSAILQNPSAMEYASKRLQEDLHVTRVAAGLPQPMILELEHYGEPAGRLWVYFVMHDGDLPESLSMLPPPL